MEPVLGNEVLDHLSLSWIKNNYDKIEMMINTL